MEDKIVMHEDWRPGIDYVEMRRWYWREAGNLTALPNPTDAGATQGTVQAVINHGRWVTECALGHGDAVIVSRASPYFVCAAGGVAENNGKWYMVTFPADRAAIEAELLKRRSTHPYKDAKNRTWNAQESLADIKRENAEHPEFVRK